MKMVEVSGLSGVEKGESELSWEGDEALPPEQFLSHWQFHCGQLVGTRPL